MKKMEKKESSVIWDGQTYAEEDIKKWQIPMVEIFETIEGEGLKAGFPTVFVRVFHCNLRCHWCDTPYSYAPAKPEFEASIAEVIRQVDRYESKNICLTGGEPLIHRHKSAGLIDQLSKMKRIKDIHIETNGAIPLQPFAELRNKHTYWQEKVRFVMDYKLPASGEMDKMVDENFKYLQAQDEIKFVIGSDADFQLAQRVLEEHYRQGVVLMSPVWEMMSPRRLVEQILSNGLADVKVSLQLHKMIWDPDQRGV